MEYRKAKPEERKDYIDLANYVFSYSYRPHNFEKLLPKVYGEGVDSASMHRVAVDSRGRLCAQIAVLPETLGVCGTQLNAGFIGTVPVHPRARGQGHMKTLMGEWIREMSGTCDFAVLSGQRQRYGYFGFTRGGVQAFYTVNGANVRHALGEIREKGLSIRPLFETEGAARLAANLNEKRPAYVRRSPERMPAIFQTFGQNALGVLENGKLIGYLLTDREGGSVSELAMEKPGDIARVVKAYFLASGRREITVASPVWDRELNACLSGFAESWCLEPSGMYRIFNFAKVLRAYLTLRYRSTGLAPGKFSAVMDGQPVTARVGKDGVEVTSAAAADAIRLNGQQAQELLLTPFGHLKPFSVPYGWFPLPLSFYAVDTF